MSKPRIQLVSIIILAVIVLSLLFSQKVNPDVPPLFAIKRIQEKIILKLKSTPEEKVNVMSNILDERLSELQAIVKNRSYGYVLLSSQRYYTLAGQITDLVIVSNLTDKVEPLKNKFQNQKKIVNEIYVAYPKNIPGNEEWKYIQDDFNYLNLYLDKLEKVK